MMVVVAAVAAVVQETPGWDPRDRLDLLDPLDRLVPRVKQELPV
jgi:hypothetical protein